MKRQIAIGVKLDEQEIVQMAELDVGTPMNMTQQVIVGSMVTKCRRWVAFRNHAKEHIDKRLRFAFIPDTLYDEEFSTFIFLPDRTEGPAAKIYKAKDKWYFAITQHVEYNKLRCGHPAAQEFDPVDTQWAAMLLASNHLIANIAIRRRHV